MVSTRTAPGDPIGEGNDDNTPAHITFLVLAAGLKYSSQSRCSRAATCEALLPASIRMPGSGRSNPLPRRISTLYLAHVPGIVLAVRYRKDDDCRDKRLRLNLDSYGF